MKIVFKNIRHHRFRYIYIGILTALMTLFIVSSIVLVSGVKSGINTAKNRLGADLVVLPPIEEDEFSPEEILFMGLPKTMILEGKYYDAIRNIDGVSACVPRIYLATMPAASCCDGEIQLIATDIKEDFLLGSWTETKELAKDEIILGYQFRGIAGDTVKYLGREFVVKEILGKTNTSYDLSGFISIEAAREIIADPFYEKLFGDFGEGDYSTLFLNAEDPKTMSNILKSQFGDKITVYATDKRISEYTGTVTLMQGFVWIVNILLVALNALAIFAITGIATQSRKNEIGSMVTIGCPPKQILSIIMGEQTTVVFFATVAAAIAAAALNILFGPMIEVQLKMPLSAVPIPKQMLIILGLLFVNTVIAGVSAFVSVRNVCREAPAELIKEAL